MRRFGGTWTAAAAGAVLLGISFYVLAMWLERGKLSDVAVYMSYADFMRHGSVPYRDFVFEYPPAALPPMLLASYMSWSYTTSFAVLMGLCGAGCIVAAALALRAVGAGVERTWIALLAIGVAPLALGSLFDTHYDLWPALLAVGAVAAVVYERPLLSGGLLGLGFAAKLWPAVLLPIAVIHLGRRRGRRAALLHVAAFVAVAAACFIPFAVIAPDGLRAMFADQLNRPLQVESFGAAVLMAGQHLGMHPLVTVTSHGAQALSGRGAGFAAGLSTAVEVAAILFVYVAFARRRTADAEGVLLASAAAVSALVAFDHVLSPQYLVWLVPLVVLVRGEGGLLGGALLLLALGLTHTWQLAAHYWLLALNHASPYSWYLLGRDVALIALAVLLLVEVSRGRDSEAERARWPAARQAGA